MKAIFPLVIVLLLSCDENEVPNAIEFHGYAGIWVPYQIIDPDGTVFQGPFTAMSIFGAYAESIQLNEDGTYIPVIWTSRDTFDLKMIDAGVFAYDPDQKTMTLSEGVWPMVFEIARYENNHIWLTETGEIALLGPGRTFKLRREVEH